MSKDFSELKREADQRLVDFLKVELKLGFSFLELAKQHRSEENRVKSLNMRGQRLRRSGGSRGG